MLDEFTDVVGEDFSVMGGLLTCAEVESVFFGSVDDGEERDFLMVASGQSVSDIAIVIGLERDFRILDQFLIDTELLDDVPFHSRRDSGFTGPAIPNGEVLGVFPVVLQ